MTTTNTKHTLEHPVTLAPLYRSEYRDDMTKARDAKGRRVSTEALVDGLAESRARIAELEAALDRVTAQRDQCKGALEDARAFAALVLERVPEVHHTDALYPVRVTAHHVLGQSGWFAYLPDARAALRACESEGGAE